MSVCIYRHPGKPPTCGQDKKPCPFRRAMFCIPWDAVKWVGREIGKMLLWIDD